MDLPSIGNEQTLCDCVRTLLAQSHFEINNLVAAVSGSSPRQRFSSNKAMNEDVEGTFMHIAVITLEFSLR